MEPCSFCGKEIPFGTGKMYVKKDAKILYFCSRKCEKNLLELKRNPRAFGYTAAARVAKKQHMAALAHEVAHKQEDGSVTPAPAKKKSTAKKPAKTAAKKAE